MPAPDGPFSNEVRNSLPNRTMHASLFLLAVVAAAAYNEAAAPPSPPQIFQVFTAGDKTADNQTIGCFRIPSLVRTSSSKLLAFAEGRVNGCRPDAAVNRPLVVRTSR